MLQIPLTGEGIGSPYVATACVHVTVYVLEIVACLMCSRIGILARAGAEEGVQLAADKRYRRYFTETTATAR